MAVKLKITGVRQLHNHEFADEAIEIINLWHNNNMRHDFDEWTEQHNLVDQVVLGYWYTEKCETFHIGMLIKRGSPDIIKTMIYLRWL
jgi:hypothetical protein